MGSTLGKWNYFALRSYNGKDPRHSKQEIPGTICSHEENTEGSAAGKIRWVHFPQRSPETQQLGAFSAHLDTLCQAQQEGIHGSLTAPLLLLDIAGLFPSQAWLQLLPSLCLLQFSPVL